ncbi:MAG: molybdopterin-guanine dinucleotide biosynthesis protein B [Gemmatimonadota bacterium]|jgi:molybdopterin-guanine dinucleotide biosynthesis protein B
MSRRPWVLSVVGRKNAGKTELTVALGGEFNRRGYRVMTVKHSHGFSLDQPGKDSWRHRHEGGARRTVLASPAEFAVVGSWPAEEMPLGELVDRFLFDADIVLAEGFKTSPEPKIEVFRGVGSEAPLVRSDPEMASRTIAVVTDKTDLFLPLPVFRFDDQGFPARLVDYLEEKMERSAHFSGGGPE